MYNNAFSEGVLYKMNIELECKKAAEELIEKAQLKNGDIVVIGCSTSEVLGSKIGSNSL